MVKQLANDTRKNQDGALITCRHLVEDRTCSSLPPPAWMLYRHRNKYGTADTYFFFFGSFVPSPPPVTMVTPQTWTLHKHLSFCPFFLPWKAHKLYVFVKPWRHFFYNTVQVPRLLFNKNLTCPSHVNTFGRLCGKLCGRIQWRHSPSKNKQKNKNQQSNTIFGSL